MSKIIDDRKFSDTVISTRIRFARNLKDTPFPSRLSVAEKSKVNRRIADAVTGDSSPVKNEFHFIQMEDLPSNDAALLADKHLISPDFAKEPAGRALLINDDESVSIMLCEEDHIRIQVISDGMDLAETLQKADRLDTLLDEMLGFAYDEKLGYLTECPTNLGTGLRASLMLHLPMTAHSGQLRELISAISKVGLILRGAYGEGSVPIGDFYQLSNQVTLGISESETIKNLQSVAYQIIETERQERNQLEKSAEFQDGVFRALGTLKYARLLSTKELMEKISMVRLGVTAGLIDGISLDTVKRITDDASAASLVKMKGVPLSASERDTARAELVRELLK